MAKYGTFLYGGEVYGDVDTDLRLKWVVEVDWDADLSFDGTNEAIGALQKMKITRGRTYFIDKEGSGFQPFRPGKAQVVLLDSAGRLNPFNYESELYPNVQPGRIIRIRCHDEVQDYTFTLFTGQIIDIEYSSESGVNKCTITAEDFLNWFNQQNYVGTLEEDVKCSDNTASAMKSVLTGVGFPDSAIDLEDTGDTIEYFWAFDTQESALQVLEDIYLPIGAKGYVSAYGQYKCKSPYRTDDSIGTITEDDILDDVYLPYPWEVVRNQVIYRVAGRNKESSGTIYSLDKVTFVGAGESITLWCDYQYNNNPCPATSVGNPAITANAQEDGGGADLSANFSAVTTKFATTAKVVVTNGGGTDGYITVMTIAGEALSNENVTNIKIDDTASQAVYGVRTFYIANKYISDVGSAEDISGWILDFLQDPHPFPAITVYGNPELQLMLDLCDRVDVELDELNIEGLFEIGYIEHTIDCVNTHYFATKYVLEPTMTIAQDRWQFPTIVGRSSYLKSS